VQHCCKLNQKYVCAVSSTSHTTPVGRSLTTDAIVVCGMQSSPGLLGSAQLERFESQPPSCPHGARCLPGRRVSLLHGKLCQWRAASLPVLQGHTVEVDTALVSTSEVTDYHMILLLGIGETRHCSVSSLLKQSHMVTHDLHEAVPCMHICMHMHVLW
jgi:hypothetical protein